MNHCEQTIALLQKQIGDALLNKRQRLVVNGLLDGVEGKRTTMKYLKLAKCSHGHGIA
jgi:hypothetical protein